MKRIILLIVPLFATIGALHAADSLRVSGTITDAETGKKLFGARVATYSQSTLTNEGGFYSLLIPATDKAELSVRLTDYIERNVAVGNRTTIDISLFPLSLAEGRNSRESYTNLPVATIDAMLAEHFGGDVRTTRHSALTGIGAAMFIRGYHSLNAATQPLIVVDGTPWNTLMQEPSAIGGYLQNPLQTIDPNDIEHIEVLKDASALYGAKGANGAIVITTKRSHSMATTIGVDLSYGFQWKPQQPDMLSADAHRIFLTEMMKGSGLSAEEQLTFEKTLLTDNPSSIYYNKYHNQTNWQDDISRTGNIQHYGINVSGGDNIALYMLSLSYTKSDETQRGSDFDRLTTRINSDITLSKQFTVGADIAFGYVMRNLADDGVNPQSSPSYIAATKSPLFSPYRWKNDGSAMTATLSDVDELGIANPVAIIQNGVAENKTYRMAVGIYPQYQLNRHLKLSDRFSYMLENTKEHYFAPRTGTPVYKIADIDIHDAISDQTISQDELFNEARLDYQQSFRHHHLQAALGWRLMSASYKNSLGRGYNTASDDLSNLTGSLLAQQLEGLHDTWHNSALTLSADYRYQQLYRLWTTLTTEASSRFGREASGSIALLGGRWALFPSVGAECDLVYLPFLRPSRGVDHLRLHASLGLTGNDDIGRQGKTSYMQPVGYLGAAYGLILGAPVNSRLKWETTRKFDVGLDAELLGQRLHVAVDYYRHRTTNLIMYRHDQMSPSSIGYPVNNGTLVNEGFDVTIDGKLIASRHLGWNATLSVNHNKNRITSLPEATTVTAGLSGLLTSIGRGEMLTAVGQPLAVFYGYRTEGVFSSDAEASRACSTGYLRQVNEDTSISRFKAGDVHFSDLNGDGFIDAADRTVIGNPSPDVTGAFANHFTLDRLSLDVNFTYSLGGDLYNYRRQMLESMSDFSNQSRAVERRWRIDGQHTDMPRATYGDPMQNSRFSDRWIEDGSYLKLKEVRLSYQLPIRRFIEGATLWVAATDLYTWTHYLGSDPETSLSSSALYQGIDTGLLSSGRSLHFGIKLNL